MSGPACCWSSFNSRNQSEPLLLSVLGCLHSPLCAMACFNTCVQVKIPSIGHRYIVWMHENTTPTRWTLDDGLWQPKWQGNSKLSCTHFVSPLPPKTTTTTTTKQQQKTKQNKPKVSIKREIQEKKMKTLWASVLHWWGPRFDPDLSPSQLCTLSSCREGHWTECLVSLMGMINARTR